MFKGISGRLVADAINKDIINSDNIEEHVYGVNAFLTVAVNILTAVVIGVVTNMLFEILLFLLVFKSLRRYSGGAHEKTALRCYFSSFVTYAAVLLAIKYYCLPSAVSTIAVIASTVILYITSPVEAANKPLDDLERKVFKHRSHIIIIICIAVYLITHYINIDIMYYSSNIIAVSIFTVTLFALEGIRANHKKPLQK